ncbi:hypothetical protein Mgra_00009904 [Meloidogyne graminicola]|uniref:Uncharacterized protein n=1 Tax=Meloidogyne graminicola TaxID=189291 RepID=A0A8S9ZD64_9BILA|nr:hypothetical protein Mgra_00009904 [Meloidogyne graminicola]
MDYQVVSNYLNGFQLFFCSLNAIFLLILIRPLYIFSKERTALFILLSKVLFKYYYQFQQIYNSLSYYFPFLQFSYFLIMPSTFLLLNAAYFHVIMLAINRFHAVFFPINYQIWWEKKFNKYYLN